MAGGLAAQLAAKRQGLPTVQSFYGLTTLTQPDRAGRHPDGSERARLEPLLARNATWVTAGSSDDVSALARLRRSRARLSVLSAGVDVDRFTPVGPALARTDLHRIVCVAPDPRRTAASTPRSAPCPRFPRRNSSSPKAPRPAPATVKLGAPSKTSPPSCG
ncbi:hypothetical protein NIIDMKKI_00490 [Mycobacterium kansasii]|uniref:Uncharacterized protein n=1 Tax=Mycobacterium kansasii TaxID=1768 RepID=A0A7G1I3F3_MYCKA|nr:hypothetical protein NIIDMKKI_00490 [Mycobacterium kansasii]